MAQPLLRDDREPAFCGKHQEYHRRHGTPRNGSWGCPTCVKEWSDAIKKTISNHDKYSVSNRGKGRKRS